MAFTRTDKSRNIDKRVDADAPITKGERSVPYTPEKAFVSDASFRRAFASLVGAANFKASLTGLGVGTYRDLQRQWGTLRWKGEQESLQAAFFQDASDERLLLVVPTSTLQFLLDVFLGLDVERLSSDRRKWRLFVESNGKTNGLTELEREVFLGEAPRLGVFNPRWFDEAVAEGNKEPLWRTRFLGQDLRKGVDFMGDGTVYWEIRNVELNGLCLGIALLFDASALPESSERQTISKTESEPEAIVLPDFEKMEEPVTMTVRIASGTMEETDWLALRPGDILTTDAPADQLFDAIVDNKVIFKVRPGLYRGQPAVQIKEITCQRNSKTKKK